MANDKTANPAKLKGSLKYPVRKKANIEPEEISIILFAASIALGVLAGSLMINFLSENTFAEISASVYNSVFGLNKDMLQKGDIFRQSLLKYSKSAALIWLSGFLALKSLTAMGVVFSRGFAVGFVTGILFENMGLYGLFCASLLYFPQNIVFIGICILMSYDDVKAGISKVFLKSPRKNAKSYPVGDGVKLMLAFSGILLICLYEAYVCPYVYLIIG